MDAPLFYLPPEGGVGRTIELPPTESRHAIKVLRMKKGDAAIVVDGCGMAYRGFLEKVSSGVVTVAIHQTVRNFGEPVVRLTLAAGLSTAGKFDTVVQKTTELGASRIVPLTCAKSRVKLDDPKRAESKRNRLEKVAVAAMKQCRRSVRPRIEAPMSVSDFLHGPREYDVGIIFDPRPAHASLADVLGQSGVRNVAMLVGPESGFSPEEVSVARSAGFHVVGMGTRILRTETAAPVACALVMGALGELD